MIEPVMVKPAEPLNDLNVLNGLQYWIAIERLERFERTDPQAIGYQ